MPAVHLCVDRSRFLASHLALRSRTIVHVRRYLRRARGPGPRSPAGRGAIPLPPPLRKLPFAFRVSISIRTRVEPRRFTVRSCGIERRDINFAVSFTIYRRITRPPRWTARPQFLQLLSLSHNTPMLTPLSPHTCPRVLTMSALVREGVSDSLLVVRSVRHRQLAAPLPPSRTQFACHSSPGTQLTSHVA